MICGAGTYHNISRISEDFPANRDDSDHHINRPPTPSPPNTERRRQPMNAKKRLYESWNTLLPDLLNPLLVYLSSSMGRLLAPVAGDIARSCSDPRHDPKTSKILCLYFNREHHSYFCHTLLTALILDICTINVTGCQCLTISQLLVHHGLFPTAPSQPRMAISIELLDFFRCLFEQSCDATNALLVAIQSFYACRGFILKNAWVGSFYSLWTQCS